MFMKCCRQSKASFLEYFWYPRQGKSWSCRCKYVSSSSDIYHGHLGASEATSASASRGKDSPGKYHVSDSSIPTVNEVAQLMVYSFCNCFERPILNIRCANNSVHGCVDDGLGNCMSRQNIPGLLAQKGFSHQLARSTCRPLALQLLQFRFRDKGVLFLLDNATAVEYLKKEEREGRVLCPS